MSSFDWDTNYCKHCARLYGWLPATKEYQEKIKKPTVKYFTLPDIQAIDIFMLEREGILSRDDNGKLPNVVICEGCFPKVPEILRVVRPPLKDAIIPEKLQDVLTFEDDEFTRRAPLGSTRHRDPKMRRKLRIKLHYERLRLFFPFDIINFDPYDSLLKPDLPQNKLYQALERIFHLQKLTVRFLLFITTPVYDIPDYSVGRFRNDFQDNVSKYPNIADILLSSVGTTDYDKVEETKRTALGVAKSIVIRAARGQGWNCEHKGIYVYENPNGHKMLSSVIECTQLGGELDESSYVEELARIITHMPRYYPYSDTSTNQEVKEHLHKIVEYRKKSLQE